MRKYYYITVLAIVLTICLQASYISNLYNNYITSEIKTIDATIYQAIDTERHIRSLTREKKKRVPGKREITIIRLNEMSPSEKDSVLKRIPLPPKPLYPAHNIDKLIERGVIRSSGELYSQMEQDLYFKEGWPVNLRILDSIFASNVENASPHYFRKYDKDQKIVEQLGDTTLRSYNHTSKLYQIGLNGSEYIELSIDIPMSKFIKESIWTLIASTMTLLYLLLFMGYQLTTVRRKTEEIEQSQRSLNGIIHDLKSPLVSVLAMLNLAHLREKDLEKKEILGKNMAGVENMTQNIDSLLSATRMNRRKLILNKTHLELKTLISSVDIIKNSLSMSYHDKPHTINVENKLRDNTAIYADKMYLENAIRNLLENAIKYSDDGVLIMLTLEKEGEMLSVSVKDNGWGIAKEYQRRLFNQFYQVPLKGENRTGYGIGLSHVKQIVTKHGGTISVKSVKDEGSLFKLLIPLSN